jgi:hypothetical protein
MVIWNNVGKGVVCMSMSKNGICKGESSLHQPSPAVVLTFNIDLIVYCYNPLQPYYTISTWNTPGTSVISSIWWV